VKILDAMILALALVVGLLLAYLGDVQRAQATDAERRLRAKSLSGSGVLRLFDPLVVGFAALARRLGLQGHRARAASLLSKSGNPWGYAPEEYVGLCMTWAVVAYVAGALVLSTWAGELKLVQPLALAMFAYFMCWSHLKSVVRARRVAVDRQMPFVLDILCLTMGAGSAFLESCETAVGGPVQGPLEEELGLMLREVRAGSPLRDALKNMTKRTDSEEVAIFVSAVVQGEELGTPLVEIFENQSSMNRFRRTKAAEQAAAKIPNRMAVPTVFLMLSVLLLLFGPIIVKAVRGGMF